MTQEKAPDTIYATVLGGSLIAKETLATYPEAEQFFKYVHVDLVKPLMDAAQKFINKVDAKEARSIETYRELSIALKSMQGVK